MKKICLLVLILIGISDGAAFAQLAQDHSYQVTLRDYLKQFQEKDFEVELKPIEVKRSYFSTAEEAYRPWLFFGYEQNEFMESEGLRVNASHFTLDNIVSNGRVNMTVGKSQFIQAVPTAFYADWDYEGNPHYDSRAVKLRAFVASAVDMMMQDQEHERGKNDRSDFVGIQLIRWAYPYGVIKDELPQNVRRAYEKGLIKMFERLEEWGTTGIHADMDVGALVGILYTAKYVDSENLQRRAERHVDMILDKHFKDPGYIDHGSAYDAGYNGISAYFINFAAQLSEYKPLIEAVKKMSRLKAYMTLPDPDGREFSPFHSNPSSGGDAPHDYWGSYNREVGMARYSDDAVYLALSGGKRSVQTLNQMGADMERMLRFLHHPGSGEFLEKSDKKPGKWKHEHWIDGQSLNATAMYMQDDLYPRLKSLQQSNSKLTKSPFSRDGDFTESLGDKMLSVKRQSYGTIIFNDRLSWWTKEGQTETINGFGGGNLSAFWTPSTGTVLLSGTKTAHGGGLDLKDWQKWPMHAVSGEASSGRAFSSGIQRYPKANYELNRTNPRISLSGDLTDIYADPTDALQGKAKYNRIFDIKDNGIEVTTSVEGDGSNRIKSLYEILPVYLRHGRMQKNERPTEIQFEVNGSWQNAGTSLKTVSRIRLKRFSGAVIINFENPRQIKLSNDTFYQAKNSTKGMNARNIMIKMGDFSRLGNSSVSYFIRSSSAPDNSSWGDTDDNANEDNADEEDVNGEEGNEDDGDKGKGDNSGDDGTDDGNSDDNKEQENTDNTPPSKVNVKLQRSNRYLTAEVENVSDPDGDDVNLVYDWRISSKSIAEVNIPFDIIISDSSNEIRRVHNYTGFKNNISNTDAAKLPKWNEEGRRGGAALFDGKNDYMRVSKAEKNENRNFKTFSVEAWVKHDGWGEEWASILSKPYYKSSWETPWAVFKLSRYADKDNLNFQITTGGKQSHNIKTKHNLRSEEWTHIVGTYDGKKLKVYVNGTLDNEETVNRPLADNPETDIYIGKSTGAGGVSQHYKGLLDEIRVLNIAISANQVKQRYKMKHNKMALDNTKPGQKWSVSVSANDAKTVSEAGIATLDVERPKDTTSPEVNISHVPSKPNDTQEVTFTASASDDSDIKKIFIYLDGKTVKTCTGENTCKLQMDPFKPGSYKYSAKAIDKAKQANGATSGSTSFKVTAGSNSKDDNDKGKDNGLSEDKKDDDKDKDDGSDKDENEASKDTTPPEVKVSHLPSKPDDTQKVTLTANASDDNDIKEISIILNGKTVKTCKDATTCKLKADPFKAGKYDYYAKAQDKSDAGNSTKTSRNSFNVTPAPPENTPPVKVKVKLQRDERFLTAEVENISDPDGDDVNLVFDWRINSESIAEVNIPFDVNFSDKSADTQSVDNYSSFQNIVTNREAAKLPKWSEDGRMGGASLFDGINDYMRVSKAKNDEPRKFRSISVEAWVKHDGWGEEWASIISKPYAKSSWTRPWAVFKLSRYADKDNINFQITTGDKKVHNIRTKQNLPADEWTHIVGTYNGKKMKVYVNGILDNEETINRPLADNPETDIYIGKSTAADGISQHYRGLLDEVRVLNVAITSDQVKQHYQLNYNKIALDNAKPGQEWQVAVSASDAHASSEAVATNAVILSEEDLPDTGEALKSTLVQNFPNPFRSSTTIPYSLENEQDIEINIYDSSGRLVDTVYRGSASAGGDSKRFNPSQLSSGVYFYQLVTNDKTITKKMTLLK
jgi:hypothetical protein